MEVMSIFTEGTSVVVVNYRTPHDLAAFIESYKTAVPAKTELIIVNVEPTDADLSVAEAAPYAQHIVAETNVGYAKACNRAARQTSREVIAFFNADTRLSVGLVDVCSSALVTHEDWGVLGPRQVNLRNQITHAGILGTNEQPTLRGWLDTDRGQYSDVCENAVSVSGSAYFVKRRVWDELAQCELYREVAPRAEGAFLPTQHYYEETWCSYHARSHGWKVVYFGTIAMTHLWHQASVVGGWAEAQMTESQEFFRKACSHHEIGCD